MRDCLLNFALADIAPTTGNGSLKKFGEFTFVLIMGMKLPGDTEQPEMDAFAVAWRAGEQVTEKLRQRSRHGITGEVCVLVACDGRLEPSDALGADPLGGKCPFRRAW